MSQQAQRVIFIDLARAVAVVMMVYGHTVSALLANEYRVGRWYDVWVFQRGLTSALFLLVAGFAFSIATIRHWPVHTRLSPTVWRRVRRFVLLVLLGYGLHFPVTTFAALATASDERWRSFLAVDVLQLIGTTFIVVQALVIVARTSPAFMAAVFLLGAAVVAGTPAIWSVDWPSLVPLPVAAYLSPAVGSLFPLFPWAAFVLIGAGMGQLFARWGPGRLASFANWILLAPGTALVVVTLSVATLGGGGGGPSPPDVLVRTGACFIGLGLMAHVSRVIGHLPHVVGAVAQESLLVYFVHLCIVYGSIWAPGLQRVYGEALAPGPTLLIVVALLAAMFGMAWSWNTLKHTRPRAARWTSLAVGAVLVLLLV